MRSTKWVACTQQREANNITMLSTHASPAAAHQAVSHLSHACLEDDGAQRDSVTQVALTQRSRHRMWQGLACSTMGPPDLSMSHLQCIETQADGVWAWKRLASQAKLEHDPKASCWLCAAAVHVQPSAFRSGHAGLPVRKPQAGRQPLHVLR